MKPEEFTQEDRDIWALFLFNGPAGWHKALVTESYRSRWVDNFTIQYDMKSGLSPDRLKAHMSAEEY